MFDWIDVFLVAVAAMLVGAHVGYGIGWDKCAKKLGTKLRQIEDKIREGMNERS